MKKYDARVKDEHGQVIHVEKAIPASSRQAAAEAALFHSIDKEKVKRQFHLKKLQW